MALMQTIVDSFSGLVNSVTGTGTARDKSTYAKWQFARPLDDQLISLYRSTWIARKIVDVPIDDMLREGWTWQADKTDMTLLEEEEKRLGLRHKLHQALKRDAVYGGGAFIIGDGAANPEQPLVPDSIGKGGIQYLIVSGRGELHVERLVRRPGPDYGQPEIYVMTPMDGGTIRIHPSRVIPFSALPIPSPLGVMSESEFWGDSSLAAVMRDIAAAASGIAGTGRLMDELAVAYHKIAGFTERMAQSDGEDAIRRVINLMNQMKSSVNAVAMDAEDSVEVITASFTGIPDALRSLMQNVAGAADIPLTRFLGNSPDGMNSTGASDIRNYYDRLAGRRASFVEPGIAYLDQFLIRSALGKESPDIYRIWNPLWQLSEVEQVDLDAKKLKTMQDLQTAGIVHDHVVHEITKTMMIDSPTFQGAETAFDEAESMPDPEPEEVEQANTVAGKPQLRVVDEDLEDTTQPRHPAGSSKGGQWTKVGSGSGWANWDSVGSFDDSAKRSEIWGGRRPDFIADSEQTEIDVKYRTDYFRMNDHLRNGNYPEEAANVAEYLSKFSPAVEDHIQYRGTNANVKSLKVGDSYTDPAFMSTSASLGTAYKFSQKYNSDPDATSVIFVAKVNKGTLVRGYRSGETELVIAPGARISIVGREKRIVGARKESDVIYLEIDHGR